MTTLFGTDVKDGGECRPCYINGRKNTNTKALFHCWCSFVGMGYTDTAAIVELEDGTVTLIHPQSIKFSDDAFSKYCWNERGTK